MFYTNRLGFRCYLLGFVAIVAWTLNSCIVQKSAMAKAITGHSTPRSGMAMAIATIPVAPPMLTNISYL